RAPRAAPGEAPPAAGLNDPPSPVRRYGGPVRVSLMIEGQEGVTWPQWVALARACEDAGLEGLFRSDHYSGFFGGGGGADDAGAPPAGLAAIPERIQLAPGVSPATFRPPSVLARMVVTASHISGGRVELGF